MFSSEFLKDYETYGKNSQACKHAYEQLKRSVDFEKARKKAQEDERMRKQHIETIERLDAEIAAIKLLLSFEENTLSKSTKTELSEFLSKSEAEREVLKQKVLKLKKDRQQSDVDREERLHQATLGEILSFFL